MAKSMKHSAAGYLSAHETTQIASILRDYLKEAGNPSLNQLAKQMECFPSWLSRLANEKNARVRTQQANALAQQLGFPDSATLLAQHQSTRLAQEDMREVNGRGCAVSVTLLPPKNADGPRAYALELRTSDGPVAFFTLKSAQPDMQAKLLKLADQITTRRAGPMVAIMMLRTGLEQMRLREFGVTL